MMRSSLVGVLAAVISAALALSCSSDEAGTSSSGAFSTTCTPSSCASGLICAQAGTNKGLCTKACEKDSECSLAFGENALCLNDA